MAPYKPQWGHILRDCIDNNTIRELHLRNIPVLRNCRNWREVYELGYVEHKTKYALYKGLLVRYGGGIYYISEEKMNALKPFRTWNRKKNIRVIEPEL